MSVTTGLAGIAVLLVLLALRVPVAVALILVSFGGIWLMLGFTPAVGILTTTPYDFVASWTLSAVPMFLLMGFVAYHAGLTTSLFGAANRALRRMPGGLGMAAVLACTGFASVCGSSLACAAAMGRIAIPEMIRAGYRPSFATGTLAAGGTIGALIPPSILMIIYGVFAETSVTKVFLGGISVGVLTAASYCLLIYVVAKLRPDVVPLPEKDGAAIQEVGVWRAIWPLLALIALVFGGLFSGLFTATEAGAIGAAGAIVIALVTRELNWKRFRMALLETVGTSVSLFIIGVGAVMFTRFLGLSGTAGFISSAVTAWDLNYVELMILIVVLYLILGMFMEPFGAMLVTLPVLLPLLNTASISLVWFGVLLVKLLEVGMITPPLGMNVFVIRNVAGQYASLNDVFRGVSLFIVTDIVIIALLIAFPGLVLAIADLRAH
ncbi:TRAP transporter large permease [Chelativorans sp. AA-79]|uniref:TRAP transporter large permease n=1 Tax=Chelativorans sp. AA-79 TaxID=3028735 RepID=UPI0023F93702|nr:TRAP transporter large permease [Chelativorans sp. AA-79]WEX10548.1 TRAP transporter large permease [Chelativorans sp. AA-79]